MKKNENGYITLYFALTLGIMMVLIFTVIEGVRMQTIRTETEGIMDIGLHSVFGEYHRELLAQYDLFYIDTSYGGSSPDVANTAEHLQYYMNLNFKKQIPSGILGIRDFTALHCNNVFLDGYRRATDEEGKILKEQIVDYMKDRKGIILLKRIVENANLVKSNGWDTRNLAAERDAVKRNINGLLEKRRRELLETEEEEIEVSIDNPADYVDSIRGTGILGLALPPETSVSSMAVHPENYQSHRTPLQGSGKISPKGSVLEELTSRLLFQEYLFEKCGSFRREKEASVLKYQLEYLLKGQARDEANLRQVLEDILHIREAANFAYLMSDGNKQGQADIVAAVVTAGLGIPELKEPVKLSVLFAWSYAESVKDIRILLDGGRVPIFKSESSWNTPLLQLLTFTAHLGEYRKEETGMSYEDYLGMFLYMKQEKELCFRFMDVCEMDIRVTPGNADFRMDGCIEALQARANVSSGYGYDYEIIREFTY